MSDRHDSPSHSHDGREHGHSHGLSTHRDRSRRALLLALGITATFFVVEVVGGIVSGSLALLADAGHMLTDVLSLAIAVFANWFGKRSATRRRTYGWQRVEVLAALINGITLLIISVFIAAEAIRRFHQPPQIQGGLMLAVSISGLIANLACGAILFRESHSNLNVKGAFLHVATDVLGSIGAVLAAVLIWWKQLYLADPILSIVISVLVLVSASTLLRECISILLQSAPAHLDLRRVTSDLMELEGVTGVHDLHAWTLNTGFVILTVHVVTNLQEPGDTLLIRVVERLKHQWGVRHVTVQIEQQPCSGEPGAACYSHEPSDPHGA